MAVCEGRKLPSWWKSDKPWIIGDCLEGMKDIPDKAVNFVFADPPYGCDKAEWDGKYLSGWEKDALRISRKGVVATPGEVAFAECINNFGEDYKAVYGCHIRNGMTLSRIGFQNLVPCVVAGKVKMGKNISECIITGKKADHPTPKPIEMMIEILLRFTDENDIVLDPFLGSGTTLLACRKTDRIGLGFEINPDYEDIIRKRSLQDIRPLEDYFDQGYVPKKENGDIK